MKAWNKKSRFRPAMFRADEQKKDKILLRECSFEIVTDKGCDEEGKECEKKTVRASISSETPYWRDFMWDQVQKEWITGYEVLGHGEGEVDFSRCKDGLVIQDTHHGDQIGLMDSPKVENGKICGDIRFCSDKRSQCIAKDACDGIRRNMSVGYFVNKYKLVGEQDNKPVYRAVSWTPYEASFVNCPADTGVGVGRSQETKPAAKPAVHKETKTMDPKQIVECFRLARAGNVEHGEVKELIESGKTFDEVREILEGKVEAFQKSEAERHEKELKEAKASSKPAVPAYAGKGAVLDDGARREIEKRYSVSNVLRSLAGEKVDIGFEREISEEISKRTGKKAQGLYLPDCVRSLRSGEMFGVDNVQSHIAGDGRNVVDDVLMTGSFIDALRDTLVLSKLGMTTLGGLEGDITIPKGGLVQAAWNTAEDGDASKTNPTMGQIKASPKTGGAYVDITRKLLMQASIDVKAFVTRELVYSVAHLLESAAFATGEVTGAPTGLVRQITQTVNFVQNAPTKAKILEMITKIEEANASGGRMAFCGRPSIWALLGQTLDYKTIVGSGDANVGGVTSGKYLLDTASNTCEGYAFEKSNIAPAKSLIFGDWTQLMLCLWSGTDLIVDQYSQCTKGALRVVALQDADFIVRQPTAFVKNATDMI